MRSTMWPATIVMSLLVAFTMGQKECSVDANCPDNQWCYQSSQYCVDFTLCERYNRKESSKPSRDASECGPCLEGYTVAESTLGQHGVPESCTKDMNATGKDAASDIWTTYICVATVIALVILFMVHCTIRCKCPYWRRPADEPEKSALPMIENGNCASGPPEPSSNPNMNNNRYDQFDDKNLFSTTKEHRGTLEVDEFRPLKAQAFYPPNYVRTDQTYHPGDIQTVQTTFSPPDNDEETIPSPWTPGPPTAVTIPRQPFAAISEEVQDNTSNTALQRLACPTPSTSYERNENRQNNTSSGNSGGFGYNNMHGNAGRNSDSYPVVQICQVILNQSPRRETNGS